MIALVSVERAGNIHVPVLIAILCGAIAFCICNASMDSSAQHGLDSNWGRSPSSFAFISSSKVAPHRVSEPIQPIGEDLSLKDSIVKLGRDLFHEKGLSADGTISCATCHVLEQGGVDGLPVSLGIGGQQGAVNAPTVYNSSLNFTQFWDGRAETLEEQVDGPLTNPLEMGSTWDATISFLNQDETYRIRFQQAFDSEATPPLVRKAIADFERSLTTPDNRFDDWLAGDETALTAAERRGYQLFKSYRCITCHQGVNVGGNSYQRLGVMKDYFSGRREPQTADLGRFNVTGDPDDKFVFRVPALRNVETTAPYFHDGSSGYLEDAVAAMIQYQLGRKVISADVADISSFLKSLTGLNPRNAPTASEAH